MSRSNTQFIALIALVSVAACSKDTKPALSAGASDSTPELTLASRDTTSVPQLQDRPVAALAPAPASAAAPVETPAPIVPAVRVAKPEPAPRSVPSRAVADEPAPAATPAPPARREIRSGTALVFRTSQSVCDVSAKAGQTFHAALDQPVYGSGGAVMTDGSALIRVVSVNPDAGDSGSPFVLEVVSIDAGGASYPASANIADAPTERHALAMKKSTMGKGAALGALGGLLMGRSVKGVLAGAAAGTAGGAVVANANRGYEMCIPAGATLTATLKEPIAMTGG